MTLVPHIDLPPYALMAEIMRRVIEYRKTIRGRHVSVTGRREEKKREGGLPTETLTKSGRNPRHDFNRRPLIAYLSHIGKS